jgi:hypothetical protein
LYAARAGEKLREQKLAAGAMSVFVTTSRFIKNRYFNSHTVEFAVSTNDRTYSGGIIKYRQTVP